MIVMIITSKTYFIMEKDKKKQISDMMHMLLHNLHDLLSINLKK